MSERDLYHGGAANRHFIHGQDVLISSRHPESPSLNATLTDSFEYAAKYAYTRTIEWETPPYVAVYRIPDGILRYEGDVSGHPGVGGWSTTVMFEKDELPNSFYYSHNLKPRQVAELVLEGTQFYGVFPQYFVGFMDIEIPEGLSQFIKRRF